MHTFSSSHFPQIRFSNGDKFLYNSILKKRFKNRPEERVRLRYVEYLLNEAGFSKNRIAFEAPVEIRQSEQKLRADLLLYNRKMEPFALIECKSEKIKLSEKAAEQIARYNQNFRAPYLMITNGTESLWFHHTENEIKPIESPINGGNTADITRNSVYWTDRGFIAPDSTTMTQQLAETVLNSMISTADPKSVHYLDIPAGITPFPANHYYRVYPAKSTLKVAVTLLNNGVGDTLLTSLLNQNGKTRSILWMQLDNLIESKDQTYTLLTEKGIEQKPLPNHFRNPLKNRDENFIKNMANELLNFFD